MDPLNLPLPSLLKVAFRTGDQDEWPLEATLVVAAYDGNIRRLKEIATRMDVDGRGVDSMLHRRNYEGLNALHAAVGGEGVLPMCRYLVEEVKMDVNKRDTFKGKKMTPLQHAVFSGNLPVVRYLLDHGADLHQEGDNGFTALHTAAEKGRCAIAKLLLSRELTLMADHAVRHQYMLQFVEDMIPNKEMGLSTPVSVALRTPSLSCLKLLIQAGAEVNGIGQPLAVAARAGLTEAIECLLEAGANPNTPNMYGRIPIELAAMYGTTEDVEILFPFTSPIPTVTNWSVDGIINHMKLQRKQLEAVRVDPYDATLFSNRSLCWLSTGDGRRALQDAVVCEILQPKWGNAYLRQGQALMLLKDYEKACDTLTAGLEVDPLDDELDKLYWEAMELKDGSSVVD